MFNEIFLYGFKFNHITIKKNLADISDEESLTTPIIAGNCINWITGHIIVSRDILLKKLGDEIVFINSNFEQYERGSSKFIPKNAVSIATLLNLFGLTQEKLLKLITTLNLNGNDELCKSINGFLLHESYHIGQIGILRRFLGKEGGIK